MSGDEGVSSVVGTVLMLGLTVTVFSVVSLYAVTTLAQAPSPPRADVAFAESGARLVLRHQGGEPVHLGQATVTYRLDGTWGSLPLSDPVLAGQTEDGRRWRIGEELCLSCVLPPGAITEAHLVAASTMLASYRAEAGP